MIKLRMFGWLRKNPVLSVSVLLALMSSVLVPPDGAYLGYLDFRVLSLLFCLMAAVAALGEGRALEAVSFWLLQKAPSLRALALALVSLCFFSSMLITNDVALITFVPLALLVLRGEGRDRVIYVVVLQTAAANLGSMLTPLGNPQNLFLYSHYALSLGAFLRAVLPAGLASASLLAVLVFLLPNAPLRVSARGEGPKLVGSAFVKGLFLLAASLLAVLRILPWEAALLLTFLLLAVSARNLFLRVDWGLLATFCGFFVFVGNLSRLSLVREALAPLIAGRELLAGALVSQLISNVPAALMLSAFTENGARLLTGVNVGGLGTLIASLASVISFQLYQKSDGARAGRYLAVFSAVNFGLLAALRAFCALWGAFFP